MNPSHHRVCLNAANGSSLEILGFIKLSLVLGDITHRIDALVVRSLGHGQILLDNDVLPRVGTILDWKNQHLTFSCSAVTIPATHRSPDARAQATSSTALRSVAAVHKGAEVHTVKLRNRINLRPRQCRDHCFYRRQTPPTTWKLFLNRA